MNLALFAIGLLWLLASRVGADNAAQGIARLIRADVLRPFLSQLFLLVLLPTGFTVLNWLATRNGSIRETNALPVRSSAPVEWQKGAALGWVLVLFAILPMVLVGDLHPQFWWAFRAWGLALLALATLLLGSLATEIAFRGFLFRRMIGATGPVAATLILSGLFALTSTSMLNTTPFSFLVSLLGGILFSLAYLRTHALWIGWGLRFGWVASMGVFFGLPLAGSVDHASVVATETSGRVWLTGGAYGPEGAFFTIVVLLVGMFLLYRLTNEFAWQYTHEPIVAAGYPMDVPPPAAHTAMEAAKPAPLVQILSTTPASFSAAPTITQPPAMLGGTATAQGASTEPSTTVSGLWTDPDHR
ncbi:MAG: CPBP family intramembrane glutamic endopeptidase [Janthinobacterium lividum]